MLLCCKAQNWFAVHQIGVIAENTINDIDVSSKLELSNCDSQGWKWDFHNSAWPFIPRVYNKLHILTSLGIVVVYLVNIVGKVFQKMTTHKFVSDAPSFKLGK